MGCYATVLVPCPKCGTEADFQSKGGECLLAVFKLADAHEDVLSDVNRHAPHTCDKCGTKFSAGIVKKAVRGSYAEPPEE